MADLNNFTLGFDVRSIYTIPYGSTKMVAGSAFIATVSSSGPAEAYGLSAVVLQSFSVSGNNGSILTYSLSTDASLPKTLTWNGAAATNAFYFNISANNQSLHASDLTAGVTVYTSAYGVLSAGAYGTVLASTTTKTPETFVAYGDAAAPTVVTLLSATGWLSGGTYLGDLGTINGSWQSGGIQLIPSIDRAITLTWVNPVIADLAAIKVRKMYSYPVSGIAVGTEIYSGTGTTYTDTGFSNTDPGKKIFYGVYAVDNVGKTSSIVSISATSNFGGYWATCEEHARLYVNDEI